jgi:hypothetical protein
VHRPQFLHRCSVAVVGKVLREKRLGDSCHVEDGGGALEVGSSDGVQISPGGVAPEPLVVLLEDLLEGDQVQGTDGGRWGGSFSGSLI